MKLEEQNTINRIDLFLAKVAGLFARSLARLFSISKLGGREGECSAVQCMIETVKCNELLIDRVSGVTTIRNLNAACLRLMDGEKVVSSALFVPAKPMTRPIDRLIDHDISLVARFLLSKGWPPQVIRNQWIKWRENSSLGTRGFGTFGLAGLVICFQTFYSTTDRLDQTVNIGSPV